MACLVTLKVVCGGEGNIRMRGTIEHVFGVLLLVIICVSSQKTKASCHLYHIILFFQKLVRYLNPNWLSFFSFTWRKSSLFVTFVSFIFQALQDLVEVVMSLKFAVEHNQGFPVEMGTGPLTDRLSQYASLLASQGALAAASTYLVIIYQKARGIGC